MEQLRLIICKLVGTILLCTVVLTIGSGACSKSNPSLNKLPEPTPTLTIETPVSKEQAIDIATQNLPPGSVAQSKTTAELLASTFAGLDYNWWVWFDGISTTPSELAESGWQQGPGTNLLSMNGPFVYAWFYINPLTGAVLSKQAGGILSYPRPTVPTYYPSTVLVVPDPDRLPISVISIKRTIFGPDVPAGSSVEITLKNISNQSILSLSATLPYSAFGPAVYSFGVSSSHPLNPGGTATESQILLGAGETGVAFYPLKIKCTLLNGSVSIFEQYVYIGATPDPVRYFRILPAPQAVPPSFIVSTNINEPFPTDIFVLSPHETIYLALYPDPYFKGVVSFSRFTFFNKGTDQEEDINFLDETPSFVTTSSCYTPDTLWNYEIRIYFENRVVASQSFEVE